MTLLEGKTIATIARAKGFATQAQTGKVRFVVLDSDYEVVRIVSDWLSYEQALEVLCY